MKKIILLFCTICIIWAVFIEPNLLTVTKYNITDKNLTALRVVLISDLHLKSNENKKAEKIVNKINKLNPDIVLITGDFLNGFDNVSSSMPEHEIAKNLERLETKYGVYSVLGNHDYSSKQKLINELNNAGINVLQNDNRYIKEKNLFIAGIDDDTTGYPDINKALENTNNPRILLMHSPDMYDTLNQKVNLVVAGHNHGGQVRLPILGPMFLPAKTGKKYAYGFINNGFKKMIVTRGIGTSIVRARFLCIPEIVVVEFE